MIPSPPIAGTQARIGRWFSATIPHPLRTALNGRPTISRTKPPTSTIAGRPLPAKALAKTDMQISEVQILGLSAPANAVVPTDHITASSTNSPSSEGVANSIDGTEAKYLNFDGATGPCGFIVTPSAGATTITGLAMQSANDSGPGSGDQRSRDRDDRRFQ